MSDWVKLLDLKLVREADLKREAVKHFADDIRKMQNEATQYGLGKADEIEVRMGECQEACKVVSIWFTWLRGYDNENERYQRAFFYHTYGDHNTGKDLHFIIPCGRSYSRVTQITPENLLLFAKLREENRK